MLPPAGPGQGNPRPAGWEDSRGSPSALRHAASAADDARRGAPRPPRCRPHRRWRSERDTAWRGAAQYPRHKRVQVRSKAVDLLLGGEPLLHDHGAVAADVADEE